MNTRTRWTEDQLRVAVRDNNMMCDVLRALGLVPRGANYKSVKVTIKKLGLDTSHWTGRTYWKGKKRNLPKVFSLEEAMTEHSTYSRACLKKRLIEEGILKNECGICGQRPVWKRKKLTLILDHVNGVNDDHRQENLRLVCPNCNSQLPTFCGKNNRPKRQTYKCQCGKPKDRQAETCRDCYKPARKVARPTIEQLKEEARSMSMEAMGRKYRVSSNAVRKWMR